MADIKIERIDGSYDKLNDIIRIYEEAFPVNERVFTVEQMLDIIKHDAAASMLAVTEEDKLIGFMVIMDRPNFAYGFFLAVDKNLRGGGYGTRIMQSFMETFKDKTILMDIETPMESAANYEQRVRRENFYKRLGFVDAGYAFDYEGDNYKFMCSKYSDKVNDYIEEYFELAEQMKQKKVQ